MGLLTALTFIFLVHWVFSFYLPSGPFSLITYSSSENIPISRYNAASAYRKQHFCFLVRNVYNKNYFNFIFCCHPYFMKNKNKHFIIMYVLLLCAQKKNARFARVVKLQFILHHKWTFLWKHLLHFSLSLSLIQYALTHGFLLFFFFFVKAKCSMMRQMQWIFVEKMMLGNVRLRAFLVFVVRSTSFEFTKKKTND